MSVSWTVFQGVFREATTDFTVDARVLTQTGGDHVKTLISNPSGSRTDALITDLRDGTYSVEYTPYEEGKSRPQGWLLDPPVRQSDALLLFRTTQRGGFL